MPNLFSNLLKSLSSIENVKVFPTLTLLVISGNNFTSSFPPLLELDGPTAVSSFSKVELFAQIFATNSTLDDTGHIPPTSPPSDYFIPKILILYYDIFQALSGLDSRKAYGLDGVPPVVLKNCTSELAHCLVKIFRLCLSTSTYLSCCPNQQELNDSRRDALGRLISDLSLVSD